MKDENIMIDMYADGGDRTGGDRNTSMEKKLYTVNLFR